MSWANRKAVTMEREQNPTFTPEMLTPTEVRALIVFGFGAHMVAVGDVLLMPRHKAEYAKFLGLVTLNVDGEV